MRNNLLILCLIGHILGDYYFQTEKMARGKEKNFKDLLRHGIYYSFPFLIFFLFSEKSSLLITSFWWIIIIHFIVDTLKFFLLRIKGKRSDQNKPLPRWFPKECSVYLMDQGIHLITILFLCFQVTSFSIKPTDNLEGFLSFLQMDSLTILKWILILLLSYKPLNITFSIIFSSYKPPSEAPVEEKKAGALIGFLERILIIIFLYINQYSAIGFILTAKSIARYDMISKNQEFAEYYLIGTLISVLSAIITYFFVFAWL